MYQALFTILLTLTSFHLSEANQNPLPNLRRRITTPETKPTPPPEMKIPERRQLPAAALNATKTTTETETQLPSSITIDDKLQIFFPKPQTNEEFLFQPYTQDFMNRNVRFLQVTLPELEKLLPRLNYQKETFTRNLDFVIKLSHYRHLLGFHKIFQISAGSLEIIDKFTERFSLELLLEIQKNPENMLKEFKELLLYSYQFNDIYTLKNLYDKILYHINKPAENYEDYEWCKTQLANWGNNDAAWTYMNYLDKQPEEIFKAVQQKLQELLYEKITTLIRIPSKTYLRHAREMYQGLKILNTDPVMNENLSLRLEFAGLQFQSYEENAAYYDEMMRLFPLLPGAKEYFARETEKAGIFLPFFDQLTEYAEKRFQRGKFACQDSVPINEEQCILHWQEAARFFSYVVQYSPFSTLSTEGMERLKTIQQTNRSKQEFISRSKLFKLADYLNKPHL